MPRLVKYFRKPAADRRMLVQAAVLYAVVAVAVRVMPFARARRLVDRLAAMAPRPRDAGDVDARIVRAVRTIAALLPGEHCLIEALVAQCLFSRHRCETTLCFGISRSRPDDRPFDAHAWLERGGTGLVGARAIAYDPLRHPSRCASSPPLR
jgi:hypothetical protein